MQSAVKETTMSTEQRGLAWMEGAGLPWAGCPHMMGIKSVLAFDAVCGYCHDFFSVGHPRRGKLSVVEGCFATARGVIA